MVKKICDPLTGLQKESGPLWIGEKCGPRKNLAPMQDVNYVSCLMSAVNEEDCDQICVTG